MGLEEGEELKHGLLKTVPSSRRRARGGHNFQQRKRTLEYDDVRTSSARSSMAPQRDINSDDVRDRLMDIIEEVVILKVEQFTSAEPTCRNGRSAARRLGEPEFSARHGRGRNRQGPRNPQGTARAGSLYDGLSEAQFAV